MAAAAAEHAATLRDLARLAETPAIGVVAGAHVRPASFEVARRSPVPDPSLAALLAELGPRFPHSAVFDGGVFDAAGACVPEAIHHSHRRRGLPPARLDPVPEAGWLPGTWLYGGVLHNHVGHFVTEGLGRLWALDAPPEPVAGVLWLPVGRSPIEPPPLPDRFQDHSVHARMMDALGIRLPQRVALAPLRVERLLVPSQLMALDHGALMAGHPVLRRFLRARLPGATGPPPTAPHRLYVSRAGLDPIALGRFAAEALLEERLAALGWEILRPETRPLAEQFAAYARASHVVFAEGSAVHVFALVARPDHEAVILLRRGGPRGHFAAQLEALGLARAESWRVTRGVLVDADPGRRVAVFPHPRRRPEIAVLDFAALGARLETAGLIPPGRWEAPPAAVLEAEIARLRAAATAADPGLSLRFAPLDPRTGHPLAEPPGGG